MFFHLASAAQWNVNALHENLIRRGLDAMIVSGSVHIEVNTDCCYALRQYHAKRIERRRAAGRVDTEPHLAIRYFPDRFVRNLELYRDPFMVPESEPAVAHAIEAINEWDVVSIDSLETEFELAYRNCAAKDAVCLLCDQIRKCEQNKRSAVDHQNFLAAKGEYDRANELRAQLDILLFRHQ